MTSLATIETDPTWLPHDINPNTGKMQFLKLPRETIRGHGFLAEVKTAQAEAWLPVEDIRELETPSAPVHFIFHSGFCRSTLLMRALQVPGESVAISEPGILNALTRYGKNDQALVNAVIGLLGQPHAEGEAVLIKPSNFPNKLIPSLLESQPDAQAIFVTNGLPDFLKAIVRKGLAGRHWGRQVYLETSTYAMDKPPFDLKTLAGLTDLQVAAFGWLLTQNWFTTQIENDDGGRIRTLYSEQFDARRKEAISAASAHFALDFDDAKIESIVDGPEFKSHSKLGLDFKEKQALDERRSQSAVVDEEIAAVCQWIDQTARASGLRVPVRQTLIPQ